MASRIVGDGLKTPTALREEDSRTSWLYNLVLYIFPFCFCSLSYLYVSSYLSSWWLSLFLIPSLLRCYKVPRSIFVRVCLLSLRLLLIMLNSTIVRAKRVDYQERSALSLSLHFTRAQFFASHAHSQRVLSVAAGPLTTALYTT